jgi:catechol 2,3-dioxygenase-like lactoylglutathione lyase family enzyme
MTTTAIDTQRFHLSLNVNDLSKAVRFLSALLGCEPKKHQPDYAKFEPENLPLVLSLEPRSVAQPPTRSTAGEGPLNHVGIRMTDSAQLVEVQRRLEMAGYSTQREEGVACCYARQTKFWVLDDDRTMWEVYVLEEDLEHRGNGTQESLPVLQDRIVANCAPNIAPRKTWQHLLSQDFPQTIPDSGELDEVLLQGTFNARKHFGQWRSQLRQVKEALRPGGRIVLHVLTANEPVPQLQPLPGQAAVVEVVPQLSELLEALEATGFVDAQLIKYSGSPCFVQSGIQMRETRVEAFSQAGVFDRDELVQVLYKGPASRLTIDSGLTLSRGVPMSLSAASWQRIAASPVAASIVRLAEPSPQRAACG